MELTIHHSSNPERSIPAESRLHQVPLDVTLIVAADSFSLFVLVPVVELEPKAVPDPEALLAIVSTTEYGQV